jgi:IS30 family transposase
MLKEHFRQGQAKPRKRKGAKDRRRQIPDRVSIDERPKVVEEKSRAGDWEGDAVESAGKKAYTAAFVDRKTKLLPAKIMPDKAAATLNRAAVRAFKPIPEGMRNTLTLDNGKEFAAHKELSQTLGMRSTSPTSTGRGSGGLTNIPTGLSDSICLKRSPLTPLPKNSLTKLLTKSTIVPARF